MVVTSQEFVNFAMIKRGNAVVAQLVEHWLPKPRVAGSSPVCRSMVNEIYRFCKG